jgi:hypothetical protein
MGWSNRILRNFGALANEEGDYVTFPFYVMFFGVASNFGTYVWRTREYKI